MRRYSSARPRIRTGHLLVGGLQSRELARALQDHLKEFSRISVEILTNEHRKIWVGSEEEQLRPMDGSGMVAAGTIGPQAAAGPKRIDGARSFFPGSYGQSQVGRHGPDTGP